MQADTSGPLRQWRLSDVFAAASLVFRIALLVLLSWIIALSIPVFSAFGHDSRGAT